MKGTANQLGGISAISVCGFKSLAERSTIELRPLTLLAGANSSGKSSIMQPVLLLKQTLEAPYDPGPLLLSNSHVRFTSADQILSRTTGEGPAREFSVGVTVDRIVCVESAFRQRNGHQDLDLVRTSHRWGEVAFELRPQMSDAKLIQALAPVLERIGEGVSVSDLTEYLSEFGGVARRRCFLEIGTGIPFWALSPGPMVASSAVAVTVGGILHVPGLRANPSRTYQTSAVGRSFPGTFDNYIASVISSWQEQNDARLGQLGDVLRSLGLTWKVQARPVDATRVEIQVGRLLHGRRGGAQDLVNITDVGFGVSQVLPVVVALLTAHPGQLVYLEQPETHLHPRAEAALARVLCDAAKRGVRVVAETHSPLMLTALQTQVAAGYLDPELVKLHWFMRRSDGVTEIASADLDANGAYGPWPEDFGEVTLKTEGAYLDAVEGVSAR